MAKTPIDMMLDGVEWIMIEPPSLKDQAQAEVDGVPWATHIGVLDIMGCEVSCVVLSNGKRLITEDGMKNFLEWLGGGVNG